MKISIVTTIYNVEKYIEKCLTSLVTQTYKDLEIILVNDCSTDSSMDIISKFDDSRIKIINHTVNKGAGWARRTGIEYATGDYVITVDGDDWISEDFIESLVKGAEETGADIVSGGITYIMEENYLEVKRFLPHVSENMQKFTDYSNQKIIFLNNKIVKRSLYDIIPYSTRRYCEDTPVILPLLYYANKVAYVDNQGYYYVQHSESLCRRVNSFEQALYKALCSKELQEFFADKGAEYTQLISQQEFIMYLRTIKATGTPELNSYYNSELGELLPFVLKLMQV